MSGKHHVVAAVHDHGERIQVEVTPRAGLRARRVGEGVGVGVLMWEWALVRKWALKRRRVWVWMFLLLQGFTLMVFYFPIGKHDRNAKLRSVGPNQHKFPQSLPSGKEVLVVARQGAPRCEIRRVAHSCGRSS